MAKKTKWQLEFDFVFEKDHNSQNSLSPTWSTELKPVTPMVTQAMHSRLLNTLQQPANSACSQNNTEQSKEIEDINIRLRDLEWEIQRLEDKYDKATYYEESRIEGEIRSVNIEIERLKQKKRAILNW